MKDGSTASRLVPSNTKRNETERRMSLTDTPPISQTPDAKPPAHGTAEPDTGVQDTEDSDTGRQDTGVQDTEDSDTGRLDTGVQDSGVADAGAVHDLPQRFGVLAWLDPERDEQGHDPRSAYVETFWLPVVGPSTTLLLRRLADEFDAEPDGFEIEAGVLSREIGLGARTDRRGAFAKTLQRCAKFHMLQQRGDVLYVRRRIPPLSHRQVKRLGSRLQILHGSWTIDPDDDGAERRTELVRATHLARTLLALGEAQHDAERQLHQWHFHPSIAWHAVQWALTDSSYLP